MHPNKRRRIEEIDETEARYLQAIIPEIDVEIGLRERLAETIEARIAWALLLQEALQNDTSSSSQSSFKDAALDTLDTIESRNRILFPADATVPVITPAPTTTKPRPPPKEKPITRSQKAKFLFLRSNDQVFILRCPTCLRHSFSMLQGLYNHSRISHHVEWGSHEECVKACAVLQQDFDQVLDLESGVEVGSTSQTGGILPGVRSLFQMAVEGSGAGPTSALEGEGDDEDGGMHLTRTLGWHSDTPALAQFLGKEATRKGIKVWNEEQDVNVDELDESSPTLLRRGRWRMTYSHRNSIKQSSPIEILEDAVSKPQVAEENQSVTSANTIQPTPSSSSRFHITCRVTITDHSLFISPGELYVYEKDKAVLTQLTSEHRNSDHTHKWMISVESSAYSLDLTSVLTSMTVSPLSDVTGMPAPHMFGTLSTKDPPFVVVGTTSEHFLAKIELKFAPSLTRREGQTVAFEHWVGLDMIGSGSPCKGEEQVVDVELDRDTIIMPIKTGYPAATSKVHWGSVKTKSDTDGVSEENQDLEQRDGDTVVYHGILKSLLHKFPMTMKDVAKSSNARTSAAPRVPYRLVADVDQLRSLVMGRRKAIEWGRAKVLRDAYTDKINELRDSGASGELIPLTVGDVFSWLEDEGHFLREKVDMESNKSRFPKGKAREVFEEDKWCRVCGLGLSLHGAPSTSNVRGSVAAAASPSTTTGATDDAASDVTRTDSTVHQCAIVPKIILSPRMPTIDVQTVMQQHLLRTAAALAIKDASSSSPAAATSTSHLSNVNSAVVHVPDAARPRRDRLIVSATDPALTQYVLSQVSLLRLSHLRNTSPSHEETLPQFPIHRFGLTGPAIDATLSPYAYLALATKQFARLLLTAALDVSKRDREYGVMFLTQGKNPQGQGQGQGQDQYANQSLPSVIFMHPGSTRKKATTGAGGRKKENAKIQNSLKVLTPMHVLRAVNDAQTSGMALYASLARLGISTRTSELRKLGSG
ncbi:hypothetical protein V5O48_001787 [Marasmius crinis-equi]|uniref:YEATS domain-containing protein n=1 Tax=Marasmius crinis-equi TaxID=585013 RepID=A0ABR3FXC3_9AGAR